MPTPENGATREPGRRPRVAVLAFKDHVLTCTDILNAARCWARRGYDAEILAYDTGLYPQVGIEGEGVRLHLVRTLYGRLRPLGRRLWSRRGAATGDQLPPRGTEAPAAAAGSPTLGRGLLYATVTVVRGLQKPEFFLRHAIRLLFGSYGCIVACDTVSLLVARTVSLVRGTPYLYHSRELVLSWDRNSPGARAAKWIERRCHRRALFTVIQDRRRADLLGRDNGVPAESFLIVPNAPLGNWTGAATRYLHDRLGIPGDAPVVLSAGGVTPETMILEIVESLAGWPPGPVLVIHGVAETSYLPLLQAAAARFPGRVYFSALLVPPQEVDALFASAAVGLAFYRPVDDNFRYVGHAAGKIFNLMKVGVPVVSNDLPGLRDLLDGNGCGRVVPDAGGIGAVLREILADPGSRRAGCRETFARFEFSRNYAEVIRRVEAAR